MVQIDVPVAFGIGSFFADAANRQLASGRAEYYYRTFAANNIFQIFFFSWIPVYFIANYFGWETTHMWWTADSAAAYPLFIPIFMVLFFGMANLGFLLGAWLVRKGRLGINRAVYLAVLIYAGLWVFACGQNVGVKAMTSVIPTGISTAEKTRLKASNALSSRTRPVALRTNKFLLLVGGWESARAPAVATASSCWLVMTLR